MACKNRSKVYLGYEDEYVTEKNRSLVGFTTNKIGGKPVSKTIIVIYYFWFNNNNNNNKQFNIQDLQNNDTCLSPPICKLCGLNQLLALQIYAALENSKYHRTLYIFACINPNCWNRNESWTCLRVQFLEEKSINDSVSQVVTATSTTSWLSSSDDWGDDGNDNIAETNGNNMLRDGSSDKLNLFMETNDLNEDVLNLRVSDQNANSPTSVESPVGGGAVGRLDSPQACAEIEGEESEVVCIDTPTQPQCNLVDLLHDVTPHPLHHSDIKTHVNLTFAEAFINVDEEDLTTDISQHERDLFLEYQLCNPDIQKDVASVPNETKGMDTNTEKYEKSAPKHGDEMFHNFISRVKRNPGQLLR